MGKLTDDILIFYLEFRCYFLWFYETTWGLGCKATNCCVPVIKQWSRCKPPSTRYFSLICLTRKKKKLLNQSQMVQVYGILKAGNPLLESNILLCLAPFCATAALWNSNLKARPNPQLLYKKTDLKSDTKTQWFWTVPETCISKTKTIGQNFLLSRKNC